MGSPESRDRTRRAHAALLGVARGALDLCQSAAFVRLAWTPNFEVTVVAVLDERWTVLADGSVVDHLAPWTSALTASTFNVWQPHLTQLAPSDGTELCLIDIVYVMATFGDLWAP
ncbi:hypothetical protein ACFV9C_42840 [Kribbella sp. NPDC059898]|uniref:hypothetical protein n=1 Tax=Kribbella sp. NPDC059898 TaxID=3346995 RepID=UPI0036652659